MAAVVRGISEVGALIGRPPVVVGGLAVLVRLSLPHRATTDLDIVDRHVDRLSHLEVLRSADGAGAVEPSAALLPTDLGPVRVDVLEVRQAEIDSPSSDPGDRLHAAAHAWAHDTATEVSIEVPRTSGELVVATTPVAEPGPLIAMKLQAVADRSSSKQGTDLLDIVRLTFDPETRPLALEQISSVETATARDMALHVGLWFVRNRALTLRRVRAVSGSDVSGDDLDLVAELLLAATRRT